MFGTVSCSVKGECIVRMRSGEVSWERSLGIMDGDGVVGRVV
jgi:hypothetical protein